jgi:hypothetical protein
VIRITTHGHEARVEFPYDDEARLIIRSIPGRTWDPERRCWTIERGDVDLAARRFSDAGFGVTVDGKPWTSPSWPRSMNGSAVDAFYAALPATLREAVYKALVRVLHPDAGGDTRLMRELNASRERHPS